VNGMKILRKRLKSQVIELPIPYKEWVSFA